MTHVARIAAKLFNRPLLLLPETAITIASDLAERFGVEALQDAPAIEASRFRGKPVTARMADGSREELYSVENGVAVIPVMGELVNRGAWIGASSGLTSYEGFAEQLRAAAADTTVRGILLDMESPGGEASGAMEMGGLVRHVSAQKPIVAFVNGMAASAAYAIASGANHIVTTPSGVVGSIGVVMLHLDRSEAMASRGVKPTLIYAGAHKVDYSSLRALPDDARARLQAGVDDLYDLFVQTVASHRGLLEKDVRATEGGVLMGRAAVEAGLADQVGGFEDAIGYFDKNEDAGIGTTTSFNLGATMADNPNPTIAKSEHDQALAAAAANAAASAAEQAAAARMAERQRTQAILGAAEAKGREDLAQHLAFATDMTAPDAIALLGKAPAAAAATTKGKLDGNVPNPDVQPDAASRQAEVPPGESWKAVADELNREAAIAKPGYRVPNFG